MEINREDNIDNTDDNKLLISTTDVDVHQEQSIDEDDDNQLLVILNDKVKMHGSKQMKRTYDKLSPIKSSTPISVKPKIQRNTKITSEICETNRIDNNEKFSSQVFPTKFKSTKSKSENNYEQNCKCVNCFEREINTYSLESHNNFCGCHECFIRETNLARPLTKDKLINIIRSFISNRKVQIDDQLDSHCSDCMCKNHLIHYKKNNIVFLDRFLAKHNYKPEKSNNPNNSNFRLVLS